MWMAKIICRGGQAGSERTLPEQLVGELVYFPEIDTKVWRLIDTGGTKESRSGIAYRHETWARRV